MKTATKSYRIFILLTVFILSIICAFGVMNTSKAYAENNGITVYAEAEDFFKLDKSFDAKFNPEGLRLLVNKTNSNDTGSKPVKFKNDLMVNDLDIKMKLPADATTSFRFDVASHYVNGNPKEYSKVNTEAGTEFDKIIENIVSLSYDQNGKVVCTLNGVEIPALDVDSDGYFTLQVRVKTYPDNKNYLTIGEFDIKNAYNSTDKQIYYAIKNIDNKAVATEIELDFNTSKETEEYFVLVSVDQKASDPSGAYNQSLAVPADQSKLTLAKPRVYLNDSFYLRKADGSYTTIKTAYNKTYTLTINSCSLLGGYKNLYLVEAGYDDLLLESNTENPNEIQFLRVDSNVKFAVGGKENDTEVVYEEFVVNQVVPYNHLENNLNTVPVYGEDEIAYSSFKNALNKATIIETDDKTTSIAIGTDLEIPSMKDLVFDDFTPYEELSISVSYATRTGRNTSSSMKFKVNDIGEYEFLVMFGDGKNTMKAKDFYSVDEEDENKITNGKYEKYIFSFEIIDNADIVVKAPAIQGDGYLGVKYTASKFSVNADGKTIKYELFYNPKKDVKDADDAGWVAIPQASLISDTNYDKDGFDYDEVKEINYNGKLIFTPTRIGSYMIKCTASSTTSPRSAYDNTFISINEKPAVVKVPSDWLEKNVWSVVFLGIGSLCLVGIVVLLCIKPKEQVIKTN